MSRDLSSPPRLRCLAVWLLTTGLLAGFAAWLIPGLLPLRLPTGPGAGFDVVLVDLCEVVLLGCAAWLWLVTTVVAVDAARGLTVRRRGVPRGLRRVVRGSGGRGPPPPGAGRGAGGGCRGPPPPPGPPAPGHLARLMQREARDPASFVRVRPGDTLWGIATDRLGSGAEWPRLYAPNRNVVGPDPDLIRPGQRLTLPGLREESR